MVVGFGMYTRNGEVTLFMYDTEFLLERIPSDDELLTAVSALTGAERRKIFVSTELDPWWRHESEINAGHWHVAIESWVTGGEFPFGMTLTRLHTDKRATSTTPHRLESTAQLAELLGCAVLISDCTSNPFRYVWVGGYNHIMTVAVRVQESNMGQDLFLQYAAPSLYIEGSVKHYQFLTAVVSVFDVHPSEMAIGYREPSRRHPVVVYPRPKTETSVPYFQPILFLPEFTKRITGDIDLAWKLAANLQTNIWVNLHESQPGLMLVVNPAGHMRRASVEIDGDWDDVKAMRVIDYLDE